MRAWPTNCQAPEPSERTEGHFCHARPDTAKRLLTGFAWATGDALFAERLGSYQAPSPCRCIPNVLCDIPKAVQSLA